MSRILGWHISIEMMGLWLIEAVSCFVLLYLLIASEAASVAMDLRAANQAAVLAVAIALISSVIGLYRPETYLRTRRLMLNTALGAVLAFLTVYLGGRAMGVDPQLFTGGGATMLVKLLLAWTLGLCALRLLFSQAMRLDVFNRRVLLIGGEAEGRQIGAALAMRTHAFALAGIEPAGSSELAPPPADAPSRLEPANLKRERIWALLIGAGAPSGTVAGEKLLRCRAAGIRIYDAADFWERHLRRVDIDHLDHARLLTGGRRFGPASAMVSRATDLLLSAGMLLFTLPVMLVTALLIKLDSPGPVFYRQERTGLDGKPFTLLKFRSMCTDAEADGPAWAAKSDPRVTRIGNFIRRTRIDELPQLINVLRGEMAFIGPRPERPFFVAQLTQAVPFYGERLRVKPGVTGWAQVNYPYGASIEDARAKLSYDLYYVKHRSLMLDLLILVSTVRVILFQEGAR